LTGSGEREPDDLLVEQVVENSGVRWCAWSREVDETRATNRVAGRGWFESHEAHSRR
jgi:hypothetical protein